ncbi:MAG: uncharacterized protein JWR70_1092 [Modestobacter sp.]|nr:uncharacterized protein [Modestobacter sp.]
MPFVPDQDRTGRGDARTTGDSEQLPEAHVTYGIGVADITYSSGAANVRALSLDEAADLTRTGDVWVFRGASLADRAIQTVTNAPVNHVGMAVVIDDLPPLLWHAELGHSLADAWSGRHQRGVQLHDLRDAACVWRNRYGQRAWMRQLVGPADDGGVTRQMEDAVLCTIARLDGKPFPTTRGLARGWVNGRLRRHATNDTVFCAELVAATYTAMGLLPGKRPVTSYDPGSFWSGDRLELVGATLGPEVAVDVPVV